MRNRKLLLFAIWVMVTEFVKAASGCDWQVRTNGTWNTPQVSWGQTCAQRSWYYPNGIPIPTADIVCCDFDEDGNYTGTGINCPISAGVARDPNYGGETWHPEGSTGDYVKRINRNSNSRYHGNWEINKDLFITTNSDGGIYVINKTNGLKYRILDWDKEFSGKPVTVSTEVKGEIIEVHLNPLDGKINKLDLKGEKVYRFDLHTVKSKIYQENIDNIVSIYPNPTNWGDQTKIEMNSQLSISDIRVYDLSGVQINVPLNKSTSSNKLEIGHLNKGTYFLIFNCDGVSLQSKALIIE